MLLTVSKMVDSSFAKNLTRKSFGAAGLKHLCSKSSRWQNSTAVSCCLIREQQTTFENLLKVGPDGWIHWKAQLPRSHDAFTRVIDRGSRIEAQAWTGHLVEINLTTGQTKIVGFVK